MASTLAGTTGSKRVDPDHKLWSLSRDRDSVAFTSLQRKYHPLVRGEIKKRCYHASEEEIADLEQMIWIAVWNALVNFRGISLFSTWLVGVTKNTIYSAMRRQRTEREGLEVIKQDIPEEADDSTVISVLDRVALEGAVTLLSTDERIVIYFRYYKQLTDERIAERTGIPLGTVKLRIRTGLKRLRAEFAQET